MEAVGEDRGRTVTGKIDTETVFFNLNSCVEGKKNEDELASSNQPAGISPKQPRRRRFSTFPGRRGGRFYVLATSE